jgi:hypothetical protein
MNILKSMALILAGSLLIGCGHGMVDTTFKKVDDCTYVITSKDNSVVTVEQPDFKASVNNQGGQSIYDLIIETAIGTIPAIIDNEKEIVVVD